HNSYLDHLKGFFKLGLPGALGVRLPLSTQWVVSAALGLGLYAVILAGLGVAAFVSRRKLGPLLVIGIAYPFVFALSPYSWYLNEPRYLLLLSPVLVLVIAAGLARAGRVITGLGV